MRDVEAIDNFVAGGNERLYNVQQGDVWGSIILDQIAPVGRGMVQGNEGFSYRNEVVYANKSNFLKDFYTGGAQRPQQ